MKKILNNEKGITGMDIGIAIIVIVLFVSIITTLFYQIYSITTQTKRNAEATSYITNTIENILNIDYDSVVIDSNADNKIKAVLEKVGAKQEDIKINEKNMQGKIGGYNITVSIESYKDDIKQDTSLEDVIKKIIVKAEYSVNKENKSLEISTVKLKEK